MILTVSQVLTAAGALLVLAAGIFKVSRPAETAGALEAVGLPRSVRLVRLLGAGEVVLGLAAVSLSRPMILAVLAIAYLGFAAFSIAAIFAKTPLRSCGCFGKVDTPPSWVHVGVNLVLAGAAVVAAFGRDGLGEVAGVAPWIGVAVLAYLTYGLLSALPMAQAARSGA